MVRGGVEPPTFRFSEVQSLLKGSRGTRSPSAILPAQIACRGLQSHGSSRAAECPIMPLSVRCGSRAWWRLAAAMLAWPSSRRRLMARLRGVAVTRGAFPVLPAPDHTNLDDMDSHSTDWKCRSIRRISRAMSDQDRRRSLPNADSRRGAGSPNPGAVRLAAPHGAGAGSAARPCSQFGLMLSHWKGAARCDRPRSRRLLDGRVNRDAPPRTESPGSSLRRRPQLAESAARRTSRGSTSRAGN